MEMAGSRSILKLKSMDWLMEKMGGKGSKQNQACPPAGDISTGVTAALGGAICRDEKDFGD